MESDELFVTVGTFNRLLLLLLYLPIGLICFWRLFPRLSPTAKRLAMLMLVAQVLAIVISLEIQSSSAFERWLWRLNREWNIPATLASTQLALVGSVALTTAWIANRQTAWRRLYLIAIGSIFLILALDEYQMFHEDIGNWRLYYAALGLVVVASTVVIAARSPRRTRIWYVLFLVGLAASALGAFVFDDVRHIDICDSWGMLLLDGCLKFPIFEEYLELSGIFLVLVAMLGQFSEVPLRPSRCLEGTLYVLPALWILLLFQTTAIIPIARQVYAQPAAVEFKSDVHLHGFRLERGKRDLKLHLYLSPRSWDFNGLGYSIHVVDQVSGDTIVSRDRYADVQLEFVLGPGYVPVYRQWMKLDFPRQAPVNRALWIVLTLWYKQDEEFVSLAVISSDHRMLNETQVILGEFVLPLVSAAATSVPLAAFDNGIALVAAELPASTNAGETLTIPITWSSDLAGVEDHVQFLHLGHAESGAWWGYDQQPLGARLPTRLWYDGLVDTENWQVPLPADLQRGLYTVSTGLYRTRDQERVPARDTDGSFFRDALVPLGSLRIE